MARVQPLPHTSLRGQALEIKDARVMNRKLPSLFCEGNNFFQKAHK